VTARAYGQVKKSTESANCGGVVTERSGAPSAIASKTDPGVAALASVVRKSPPH
jgi:hypothetical protein